MTISKRLRAISDFISDNSFILDVGCDHALLDVYCALNKKNVKAIASDIKEGPLAVAKENVKKYDVSSKVTVLLGDGLSTYQTGVDTVVISGLGSSTIVSILNKGSKVLPNVDKLIISSNNDYCFLRKSICDLGFCISDEIMVYDNDKFYPVILFKKGHKVYDYYELKYGPVLLDKMDKDFIGYLNNEKSKLFDIYRMLRLKHMRKRLKVKKDIKFIEKKLR
ncbi:MAG: SAM-dependent methyltransferase [Bacilli bacterium]|nr:SAM-dependent methyltransferase [Bacilli bacterium]